MDCCQLQDYERQFDRKKAANKLEDYRRNGPQSTTRLLVEALKAEGVQGRTLLDVGGGIGAIQHELLEAGARQAVNLEASTAYIEACRQEAERRGHAERITHLHGDFTTMNGQVPTADIVTLERVICCYPDMHGLLSQSCAKTGRLLGLVYPLEVWWVRLAIFVYYTLRFVLTRNPFRIYVHPSEEVEALVESEGLARKYYRVDGAWQVVVYERVRPLE